MLNQKITYTTEEVKILSSAMAHVLAAKKGDLEMRTIFEAARLLEKPQWIEGLFDALDELGLPLERNDYHSQKIVDEAWLCLSRLTSADAANRIQYTVQTLLKSNTQANILM